MIDELNIWSLEINNPVHLKNHLDDPRLIEMTKQNTIKKEWQGCHSKNVEKNIESLWCMDVSTF